MDPNLDPQTTQPPKDLKTQVTEASTEYVGDHYEGWLRKLVGLFYTLFKWTKDAIGSIFSQLLGKD